MAKAFVLDDDGKEVVIAISDKTLRIEGNHYFPPSSVEEKYLTDSDTHTTCFWKGEASYKTIKVGKNQWHDGAWYYPEPADGSVEKVGEDFKDYYAFWRGVQVVD